MRVSADENKQSMSSSVAHVFKRGAARQDDRPVAITLDTLQQLRHHALPAAANALGVSPTALKGACRKLGITRWPYFAGRGFSTATPKSANVKRSTQKAPPTQADAATQTEPFDDGLYVDAEDPFQFHAPVLASWH